MTIEPTPDAVPEGEEPIDGATLPSDTRDGDASDEAIGPQGDEPGDDEGETGGEA